eukprot:TRINITY_DN5221_c0_g1_i1.p1 TRINITY_DN5221_c0_g1~~TRINITY_DN5221_c0_g1_i1.p1  ORF type:complete len:239 (-),score=35.26 TRINITY_DN5221_c0_g1_i1:18-734(-)
MRSINSKKLLPSINEAQELAKVQSLKDICGRWIAKQGTDLEELKDLLPPDLLKFVSFLKKQHSIRNSKDQKLQLSNDRMQIEGELDTFENQLLRDIGITDSTLEEHRNEILSIIFKEGQDTSSFVFDKKKIVSMFMNASKISPGKGPKIRVVLPGEPTIAISSRSKTPYMLPWKITFSQKRENLPKLKLMEISSYSPEISKLLLKCIGPAIDPHNRNNLDGNEWWKNPIWGTYSLQKQ